MLNRVRLVKCLLRKYGKYITSGTFTYILPFFQTNEYETIGFTLSKSRFEDKLIGMWKLGRGDCVYTDRKDCQ